MIYVSEIESKFLWCVVFFWLAGWPVVWDLKLFYDFLFAVCHSFLGEGGWERSDNTFLSHVCRWLPARFCWFSLFFIFFRILFSCCFPILSFLAPMAGCIRLLLLLLREFMYVGNIAYIGMCGIFKKPHSHMAAELTEVCCCCCCFFHKICTKFTNCKYRSRLPASKPASQTRPASSPKIYANKMTAPNISPKQRTREME